MNEESEYLFNNLKAFSLASNGSVTWDRIDKEIAYLENELTYDHVKQFFELNFLQSDVNPVIFRVFSQKFKDQAVFIDLETQARSDSQSI